MAITDKTIFFFLNYVSQVLLLKVWCWEKPILTYNFSEGKDQILRESPIMIAVYLAKNKNTYNKYVYNIQLDEC